MFVLIADFSYVDNAVVMSSPEAPMMRFQDVPTENLFEHEYCGVDFFNYAMTLNIYDVPNTTRNERNIIRRKRTMLIRNKRMYYDNALIKDIGKKSYKLRESCIFYMERHFKMSTSQIFLGVAEYVQMHPDHDWTYFPSMVHWYQFAEYVNKFNNAPTIEHRLVQIYRTFINTKISEMEQALELIKTQSVAWLYDYVKDRSGSSVIELVRSIDDNSGMIDQVVEVAKVLNAKYHHEYQE